MEKAQIASDDEVAHDSHISLKAITFLHLPTELRLEIYRYLFTTSPTTHNPWHGLLLTNKILHAELTDLLKETTLRIRLQPARFHRVLSHNLTLQLLTDGPFGQKSNPNLQITNLRKYCARFGEIVFDITNTVGPTDCRLQPSYERKGNELADALTADLRRELSLSLDQPPSVRIIWGSFSRNVYMGITTWDCCVLKGMGSMMAMSLSRGEDLSQRLYAALAMEEHYREAPVRSVLIEGAGIAVESPRAHGFGQSLAAKIKLAIHSRT